jgi:hypothetical protein
VPIKKDVTIQSNLTKDLTARHSGVTQNTQNVDNSVNINSCINVNPTYQDKYGNFFFPSLSRVKKKARKSKEKKKIINDLSNYGSLQTGTGGDPIQPNEKIDSMGRFNTPVKRNDSNTRRRQSKKAYLMKRYPGSPSNEKTRINMAKLLFNTHIPTKEIKAIEDLY